MIASRALAFVAVTLCFAACGDDDAGVDAGERRLPPLSEVVLRLADFPDDFTPDDSGDFSLDFDGLEGGSLECPAGIDRSDFSEGEVAGDAVVRGDVAGERFAGGVTIAARVDTPAMATRWLDEWSGDDVPACVEGESNVGGAANVTASEIAGARVVSVTQSGPDADFDVHLLAHDTTVGILVLADTDDLLTSDEERTLLSTFAQRVAASAG